MKRNIIILISLYLLGCASVPKQITFNDDNKKSIKKVALVLKKNKSVKVKSATEQSDETIAVLAGLPGAVIEGVVRGSVDNNKTKKIQEVLKGENFEEILLSSFEETIRKENLFEVVRCDEKEVVKLKKEKGADAIIELEVKEFSVQKGSETSNLQAFMRVLGKMMATDNQKVLWEKQVFETEVGSYSLDEYIANDGAILRKSLNEVINQTGKKLGKSLAYGD